MEFSNLIFIIVSTNDKLGDLVLFEKQPPVGSIGINLRETYDSYTLLGSDRDESHLLAKKIAMDLKTDKPVIVSSTLRSPISFSDASFLCAQLQNH
nr:unnamed protein product [Spirometra erinaceieuropaei]